eukprot:scaffold76261_cov33-Tisochrysis_lutea.AAC.7
MAAVRTRLLSYAAYRAVGTAWAITALESILVKTRSTSSQAGKRLRGLDMGVSNGSATFDGTSGRSARIGSSS